MIHPVFEKHLFVHHCIAMNYSVRFAPTIKTMEYGHKTSNLNIILFKHYITGGYRAGFYMDFMQLIYYKGLIDLHHKLSEIHLTLNISKRTKFTSSWATK